MATFAYRIIEVIANADRVRRGFVTYGKAIQNNTKDFRNKEDSSVFAAIYSLANDMERLSRVLLNLEPLRYARVSVRIRLMYNEAD